MHSNNAVYVAGNMVYMSDEYGLYRLWLWGVYLQGYGAYRAYMLVDDIER